MSAGYRTRKKHGDPCVFPWFGASISVEEGHPMLGSHGTFRCRDFCALLCVCCALQVVFFLTPLALRAQELQLERLPLSRANPAFDSMITPAPQIDPADPGEEKTCPRQTTPSPQESPETKGATSNDRIFWTMPNFLTVEMRTEFLR
jgi:hypothetical protein